MSAPGDLFEALHWLPLEQAARRAARAPGGRPTLCVSACLLGVPCRYDGGARPMEGLARSLPGRFLLPLCPEVLAGLGTPRPPMQLEGGDGAAVLAGSARVTSEQGRDCTDAMRRGVARALHLARAARCSAALLKERSPSCGVHQVHERASGLMSGQGVFAATLEQHGIPIRSEQDAGQ